MAEKGVPYPHGLAAEHTSMNMSVLHFATLLNQLTKKMTKLAILGDIEDKMRATGEQIS